MPVSECDDQGAVCTACGDKISDRYYLMAVDRPWHAHCLRCADCQQSLDSQETCFAKDGNIYCKEDYYRRFGIKHCARCSMVIAPNELVMRARDHIYHVTCFSCASCSITLATGDFFGMKDGLIYCQTHYELLIQEEEFVPDLPPVVPPCGDPMQPVQYYNGVGASHKGRPRKRKANSNSDMDCSSVLGMGELRDISPGQEGYQQSGSRQKRVRTSFKHHQLRTMKSYFALNQNPDAKDLKQLSQKTGLSKRVLQVWFQNARAKSRRIVVKPDGQNPTNGENGNSQETPAPLPDISTDQGSPAASDMSSNSITEVQNTSLEAEEEFSSTSLSDIFVNTLNTVN